MYTHCVPGRRMAGPEERVAHSQPASSNRVTEAAWHGWQLQESSVEPVTLRPMWPMKAFSEK